MSTSAADRDAQIVALLAEMTRMSGLAVLFSHAIAGQVGLNSTDLEALEILLRHGPVAAGRLAELTGLTTGAVTGIIDRLERRGFARRRPDPTDRRRVIVAAELATVERELLPLYAGMQQATSELIAELRDRDLELMLGFIRRANEIAAAEIERMQSPPDTANWET